MKVFAFPFRARFQIGAVAILIMRGAQPHLVELLITHPSGKVEQKALRAGGELLVGEATLAMIQVVGCLRVGIRAPQHVRFYKVKEEGSLACAA